MKYIMSELLKYVWQRHWLRSYQHFRYKVFNKEPTIGPRRALVYPLFTCGTNNRSKNDPSKDYDMREGAEEGLGALTICAQIKCRKPRANVSRIRRSFLILDIFLKYFSSRFFFVCYLSSFSALLSMIHNSIYCVPRA